MEQTRNNPLAYILIFVIVGALLLAAATFGVRWAKGRSDALAAATATSHQTAPAAQPKAEEPKKAAGNDDHKVAGAQSPQSNTSQPQPPAQNETKPNAAPPNSNPASPASSPAQVPSTGMGDIFLSIGALALAAFATVNFMQSRRRLARLH